MKIQDVKKLHSNTQKELESKLEELQKQFVTEKLNIRLGSQKNTSAARNIRRDIARIKTIMHNQIIPSSDNKEEKKGK